MALNANLPWIESPFFEDILKTKNLSAKDLKIAVDYHQNGYVVIPGIIPEDLVDKVKKDAEEIGFNPDIKLKRRNDQRIQDFWQKSDFVKELACHPPILELLAMLYGREALPFQTLNFKVGSQQRAHSDTIHFSSLPARFMCGVWVALEDITEENGPVFYYSESHKLPEYNFAQIKPESKTTSYNDYKDYEDFIEKIVDVNSFAQNKFLAKKGDALIWSSNIIHGGSPLLKPDSSRWSQVTHYFFEDCYYYTPMLSNMVTNELYLRNNLTNIKTGEIMQQSYNGQKLNSINTEKNLYILNNNIKPGIWSAIKNIFKKS